MQATRTFSGLVATAPEQAAVAELMAPSESMVGRPPLFIPRAGATLLLLGALLASPTEPADDED
ncbi:MAG: hypothetical protein ACRDRP_02060 [Pseudonocardiaceae bacterium]